MGSPDVQRISSSNDKDFAWRSFSLKSIQHVPDHAWHRLTLLSACLYGAIAPLIPGYGWEVRAVLVPATLAILYAGIVLSRPMPTSLHPRHQPWEFLTAQIALQPTGAVLRDVARQTRLPVHPDGPRIVLDVPGCTQRPEFQLADHSRYRGGQCRRRSSLLLLEPPESAVAPRLGSGPGGRSGSLGSTPACHVHLGRRPARRLRRLSTLRLSCLCLCLDRFPGHELCDFPSESVRPSLEREHRDVLVHCVFFAPRFRVHSCLQPNVHRHAYVSLLLCQTGDFSFSWRRW